MRHPLLASYPRRGGPVLLLLAAGLQPTPHAFAGADPMGIALSEVALPTTESAVAPEVNPPGDIPDSQVFIRYNSTSGGFSLEVPEGWARTQSPAATTATAAQWARWIDKLDGVIVTVAPAAAAPSTDAIRTTLDSASRAVIVDKVQAIQLPMGSVFRADFHANSDPNPVTSKQVRLEEAAWFCFRGGKLLTLTVWAPAGADNVDQWDRMSKSLRWK